MWNWLVKHKGSILNLLTLGGTVAAALVTGPVGAVITAGVGLVAKLAASPLDHAGTPEDAIAVATQIKKLTEAVEAAKR